jgi:hypothetical protein
MGRKTVSGPMINSRRLIGARRAVARTRNFGHGDQGDGNPRQTSGHAARPPSRARARLAWDRGAPQVPATFPGPHPPPAYDRNAILVAATSPSLSTSGQRRSKPQVPACPHTEPSGPEKLHQPAISWLFFSSGAPAQPWIRPQSGSHNQRTRGCLGNARAIPYF